MSTETNKHAVKEFFDAAYNRGDLTPVDRLFAPIFVGHNPANPAGIRGPEGMKQFVGMFRAAFSDFETVIEDQIAEGDLVVTRWRTSATHTGPILGNPPSGRRGTVMGLTLSRFGGGQVIESWDAWDMLGMLQQIGAIPASPSA